MMRASVAGVYIAHHRLYDVDFGPGQQFKVGHSGELGRRLHDGAYKTCWPAGWRYVATFELETKHDAERLEAAVLFCCHACRVDGTEIVRAPLDVLTRKVLESAQVLGLVPLHCAEPTYELPPRAGNDDGPAMEDDLVERLTALTLAPAAPRDELDELLDGDLTGFAAECDRKLTAATDTLVAATAAAAAKFADAVADLAPLRWAKEAVADDESDEEPLDFSDEGPVVAVPLVPRQYQIDAHAACVRELRANGCATLLMACRCGKTSVAYNVIQTCLADAGGGAALFLVPTLALLRQTAIKLIGYGFDGPILLVGSDTLPVQAEIAEGKAITLTMTTDSKLVRDFAAAGGNVVKRLIISTYQSSVLIPSDAFVISVFDEAHRVCGNRAPRPFSHMIQQPRVGARLYMTATAANDGAAKTQITMSDKTLFGGVAYRSHLREGIDAGYVNDFRLELVAAPDSGTGSMTATDVEAALPSQIHAAMRLVTKLLVFARDTKHASRICRALRNAPPPPDVDAFEVFEAHSRMAGGSAARETVCRRFATPGIRAIMINCRYFQEGVEIPPLDGVFFAAPRHAPRDIIQSCCRGLNKMPGKPQSVIFLPVLCSAKRTAEAPAESFKRFASIVPMLDALLHEDPRLYEYLLAPNTTQYPIGMIGTHTLGLRDEASRERLLAAVRRAVHYGGSSAQKPCSRLHRTDMLPWDRVFGEIRRIVLTLDRYPKTTDAWIIGDARVPLHRFYKHAANEFAKWRAGQPTKLEPHQIADLLSLPQWGPFGVEGPYPAKLCIDFLEQWLEESKGVPPMVEINRGGFVGLSASPMERLSGFLTCTNQLDGKLRKSGGGGFAMSPERQTELDRICRKWGLCWRKARDASGELVDVTDPRYVRTFIQEGYDAFKVYYKEHGSTGEYIQQYFEGYPIKHMRQETLEVQKNKTAPPRLKVTKRRPTKPARN
jgi:superfamily II DNA or RNA helicase